MSYPKKLKTYKACRLRPWFDRLQKPCPEFNTAVWLKFGRMYTQLPRNEQKKDRARNLVREKNFFHFFEKLGKDLGGFPLSRINTKEGENFITDKVEIRQCYPLADFFYKKFMDSPKDYGLKEAKLWIGFRDTLHGFRRTYRGTFMHAFLTLIHEDGTESIFDPLQEKRRIENIPIKADNYFGVHIPVEIVEKLEALGDPHALYYAGYLTQIIFRDTQKTRGLVREINLSYKK